MSVSVCVLALCMYQHYTQAAHTTIVSSYHYRAYNIRQYTRHFPSRRSNIAHRLHGLSRRTLSSPLPAHPPRPRSHPSASTSVTLLNRAPLHSTIGTTSEWVSTNVTTFLLYKTKQSIRHVLPELLCVTVFAVCAPRNLAHYQ